jgi:uncharacterized protein (DUF488 family)
MSATIYTIGHSTRPIGEFIGMLNSFGIETLADVRTIPKSRHNPQFEQRALARALKKSGIEYVYMKALGGLRHARRDSPNMGWRNSSFRGYADYMQSEEFEDALNELIALAKKSRTVIMCAEAVPWRCHRSLIADALSVRHIPVEHIMGENKSSKHQLTKFAQVKGKTILYPPEQPELALAGPRSKKARA